MIYKIVSIYSRDGFYAKLDKSSSHFDRVLRLPFSVFSRKKWLQIFGEEEVPVYFSSLYFAIHKQLASLLQWQLTALTFANWSLGLPCVRFTNIQRPNFNSHLSFNFFCPWGNANCLLNTYTNSFLFGKHIRRFIQHMVIEQVLILDAKDGILKSIHHCFQNKFQYNIFCDQRPGA